MEIERILLRHKIATCLVTLASSWCVPQKLIANEAWTPVSLQSTIDRPEPCTGLVVWDDSEHVDSPAVQLEFSYVRYADCMVGPQDYDWTIIEKKLDAIAGRKHQAILRFYDTYVGKTSGVPDWIRKLPDYKELIGKSEGKKTSFPDWSNQTYQKEILSFFTAFAKRYDNDPRMAYLQVGFGLWSEYHIYDGIMKLGQTFPSKTYQSSFLRHMDSQFKDLPWMISIDAADDESTPIQEDVDLLKLRFGLFDDSFLSKEHPKVNALNWRVFGDDRYQTRPCGGEFSYYNKNDQKNALAPNGPNGVSFESSLSKFHLSFIIASDQFNYQKIDRLLEASKAMGYALHLDKVEQLGKQVRISVSNQGVAPLYFDAYVAINGVRSSPSLKSLQPTETRTVVVELPDTEREKIDSITIESDRLLPGVTIPFEM